MLQTIKFSYKFKKPMLLDNNVFVLYSPQRLKFEPGEKKTIDMKLNINLSADITGSCRLLFQLSNATKLQLLKRKYKLTLSNTKFKHNTNN